MPLDLHARVDMACKRKHGQSINWLRRKMGQSESFYRTLKGDPHLSFVKEVADALGVRVEWLVSGTEPMDAEVAETVHGRDSALWDGMLGALPNDMLWPLRQGWAKPPVFAALDTFGSVCEVLAATYREDEPNAPNGGAEDGAEDGKVFYYRIGERFGRALTAPLKPLGIDFALLDGLTFQNYAVAMCGSLQALLSGVRREAERNEVTRSWLRDDLRDCVPQPSSAESKEKVAKRKRPGAQGQRKKKTATRVSPTPEQ